MRTIYITGIKKYKASLEKGLKKSELIEGKDYIEGSSGIENALYWIREDMPIKDFKVAIGTKFVWKHRMRFFNTIDEMKPKELNTELSESEKLLIKQYESKNE